MTPLEVGVAALRRQDRVRHMSFEQIVSAVIEALTAAGYTIIRDDENHKATVERCAKEADDLSRDELFLDAAGRFGAELAAASIRSLIKEDGDAK